MDEADPKIIGDSTRDIFNIVAMWGVFSTAVLGFGIEKGVVYFLNLAVQCVMICIPVFLSVAVLFIDFPLFLYARFVGKETSPGSRVILLGSLVSLSSLLALGLVANYFDVRVEVIRPLLNFYGQRTAYMCFLLLSGLNVIYNLGGMFLCPKNRKLGFLLLLPIIVFIARTLLVVFLRILR
ncbi:hypothetical protein [Thermococcus sp.]|uniref:hypothetical protein n=1 Tax=Thermococcus sp. TaxID=35749 RepID=UPI0026089FED|nr:hypothetical protein [Thermococcus sp.]